MKWSLFGLVDLKSKILVVLKHDFDRLYLFSLDRIEELFRNRRDKRLLNVFSETFNFLLLRHCLVKKTYIGYSCFHRRKCYVLHLISNSDNFRSSQAHLLKIQFWSSVSLIFRHLVNNLPVTKPFKILPWL